MVTICYIRNELTLCWCYDLHLLLVHFYLTVCLQCMAALVCILNGRFYTGQHAVNLPVLFAARSADLDRGRFLSANFPPWRVHLVPPSLLSKNEAAMCWPLCEMCGGVDDLHCCVTHSRGVLNQDTADHNIQSITSPTDVKMSNWTAGEIQEMLASPRSL